VESIKDSLQGVVKLVSTWSISLQAEFYIKQPVCEPPARDPQIFAITGLLQTSVISKAIAGHFPQCFATCLW